MLEVVVASTLIAATLLPALRILRDALEQGRRIESLHLLATTCASKLEERLCLASASWTVGTFTGDLADIGYGGVRFEVVASDATLDGGIPDRLMAIRVTTWDDCDGQGDRDASEPSVTMASKTAKTTSYEDQAS